MRTIVLFVLLTTWSILFQACSEKEEFDNLSTEEKLYGTYTLVSSDIEPHFMYRGKWADSYLDLYDQPCWFDNLHVLKENGVFLYDEGPDLCPGALQTVENKWLLSADKSKFTVDSYIYDIVTLEEDKVIYMRIFEDEFYTDRKTVTVKITFMYQKQH